MGNEICSSGMGASNDTQLPPPEGGPVKVLKREPPFYYRFGFCRKNCSDLTI